MIRDTPEEESKLPKVQDTLNLLLVGMENSEVQMLALGIFLCGSIKLAEIFEKECTVLKMHMPVDFSYLYVAIQYFYGKVEIMTIKLQECYTNWNDVYDLSFKHDQLLSSLDYLDQTMKNILETWENVSLMEMELKLRKYCIDDPSVVTTDLLELLIYGMRSERMERFLKVDLTDKGIKKIGLSIESSHTNVQKLVVKQLSEVTNQILFQLVEISGMSLKKYECLGLTKYSVERALKSVNRFLIKCNEVQIVIEESLTRYKLFFKWLHNTMLKLSDEHSVGGDPVLANTSQQEINLLAEYIYDLGNHVQVNSCKMDRVGQYFLDSDLEFPYESHSQWGSMLRENPCLEENPMIVPSLKKLSLTQQFNELKNDLVDIFAQEKTFFNKTFVMYNNVLLNNHSATHQVHKVSMVDLPNHKLVVCCADRNAYDFGFYELMAYDDTHEVTYRSANVFYMSDKTKQTIHDLQFYSQDHLSVLTESVDSSANRNSMFLQLSTSAMRGHCSNDGLGVCKISGCGGTGDGEGTSGGGGETGGDGGGGETDGGGDGGEETGDGGETGGNGKSGGQLTSDFAGKVVENMMATSFAVSGTRKVAVLLSHSRHKVRLFEMEVDEEDEDEEDSAMDVTRDSSFAD